GRPRRISGQRWWCIGSALRRGPRAGEREYRVGRARDVAADHVGKPTVEISRADPGHRPAIAGDVVREREPRRHVVVVGRRIAAVDAERALSVDDAWRVCEERFKIVANARGQREAWGEAPRILRIPGRF